MLSKKLSRTVASFWDILNKRKASIEGIVISLINEIFIILKKKINNWQKCMVFYYMYFKQVNSKYVVPYFYLKGIFFSTAPYKILVLSLKKKWKFLCIYLHASYLLYKLY